MAEESSKFTYGIKGKKLFVIGLIITVLCVLSYIYIRNARVRSVSFNLSLVNTNTSSTSTQKFPAGAIIIGVKKGGTRALISMMDEHPNIKTARGEVHFFDRDLNFEKGLNWYRRKLPRTSAGEIAVEKSPSYFIGPKVPGRIAQMSKTVKLILIVRDPVTRAISDYTQLDAKKQRKKRIRPSFEKSIFKPNGSFRQSSSIIKVSLYDVHYKRWLQYFPKDQILIVSGDQLITDPVKEVTRVERFLNVPSYFKHDMFYFNETKGFYCWKRANGKSQIRCLGSSKGRKHPQVSEKTISKLRQFFKPHMKQFCMLASVNFSWCHL